MDLKLKHKQPVDQTPSSFVLNCLHHKSIELGGKVLDLACGYGRHTHLLRSQGFSVISCDLDTDGLSNIKQYVTDSSCVCLDASKELPFLNNAFNLVVVIHYVDKGLLSRIARLISSGGFLIYETYGGQGENWLTLPLKGEIEDELGTQFSIIKLKEVYVGSELDPHVNTKLFARKNNG